MTTSIKNCFCGNSLLFENCCGAIISGKVDAHNAEELMRSRFTAYLVKDYRYVLQTYASDKRAKLTVAELSASAEDTTWLSLQVLSHRSHSSQAQVEFKAFYQVDKHYYVMHEVSDFVLEAGKWFYSHGKMQKGSGEFSPQRNSQCLCASGKKFKKCCGK